MIRLKQSFALIIFSVFSNAVFADAGKVLADLNRSKKVACKQLASETSQNIVSTMNPLEFAGLEAKSSQLWLSHYKGKQNKQYISKLGKLGNHGIFIELKETHKNSQSRRILFSPTEYVLVKTKLNKAIENTEFKQNARLSLNLANKDLKAEIYFELENGVISLKVNHLEVSDSKTSTLANQKLNIKSFKFSWFDNVVYTQEGLIRESSQREISQQGILSAYYSRFFQTQK